MPKRLIIIGTYNERLNIEGLLTELLALPENYNILVIDDSSPDGTGQVVAEVARFNKRVVLLSRPRKMGLGTAYITGFKWALRYGYDSVITMDADFSHQPKYLQTMSELLDRHDMVLGSRYVPEGGVQGWPFYRQLLSRMGSAYVRRLTGIPVKDCTSGFVGLNRKVYEKLLSAEIDSEGYSFIFEIKHWVWKQGFSIKEFPIIFIDRVAGHSKISRRIVIEALRTAWRLRNKKPAGSGRGNGLFKLLDRWGGIPVVRFLGFFTRHGRKLEGKPQKIVIIKLSAIGDTILLIPALKALRKKFPKARITAVGTAINRDIFSACGYVDDVLCLDIKSLSRRPWQLLSAFKGTKYDLAVDFDQWVRLSPILAWLSGAPVRVGFRTPGQKRHYLYTSFADHAKGKHELECFFDVLKLLDIRAKNGQLEFPVSADGRATADALLATLGIREKEPFIILHPETPAHGLQRQWPVERYEALGKELVKRSGWKILLSGTAREAEILKSLAGRIGSGAAALPQVSINDFAAILSRARLLVCGNTGIMHLACAVGTPVAALHGPTDPVRWGPVGKRTRVVTAGRSCSPCLYLGFEYGCGTNTCMRDISVESVLSAIEELVAFR